MKKSLNSKTIPESLVASVSKSVIKTYVLTISISFPKTHNKSGLPTGFIDKIGRKIKKHTIRGNYLLWKKRIDEIQKGNAVLSIRYWTGKPYNSKQKEVYVLDKNSGIGVQKLEFHEDKDGVCALKYPIINNHREPDIKIIAENDGLSYPDFKEWFKGYDLSEPMAIVLFTAERY